MNLTDIKEEAILLEKDLECISKVIEALSKLIDKNTTWTHSTIYMIINTEFSGSNGAMINNANVIKTSTKTYFNNFVQTLKDIDFSDSIFSLANLEEKYNIFNIKEFSIEYKNAYKTIHKLIRISDTGKSTKLFLNTYITIEDIVYKFRMIQNGIKEVEEIQKKLVLGDYESN